MDFKSLKRPAGSAKPVDPIQIFERLPHLPGTPNDLWRGQTQALQEWHKNRSKSDTVISLSTGAGKTLIGLLIAQSLVNEELQNVLYLCSTIDLVLQTEREARKIGLNVTTRVKQEFSNELFETGNSFCITTYPAALNPFSLFRSKFPPRAIILDDAHVAEKAIRDAFTIPIDRTARKGLWHEVIEILRPGFQKYDLQSRVQDLVDHRDQSLILYPPIETGTIASQLTATLRSVDDIAVRFPYFNVRDHISMCIITVTSERIEITVPFLPTNALPYFDSAQVRRVYLSATLRQVTDFARAFGRLPAKTIEPPTDAGNGERLILYGSRFEGGDVNIKDIEALGKTRKILVAVPSYQKAAKWKGLAEPPSLDGFTQSLDNFRGMKSGGFILVGRVDGIDLPDEQCRMMVIDELPSGASQYERYMWEVLNMRVLFASKLATRLTQLFGRINRGRSDYGLFIISGRDLNNWLRTERNRALLPTLLRKQLLIGEAIHDQTKIQGKKEVEDLAEIVNERQSDWLNFYAESIEGMDVSAGSLSAASEQEEVLTDAALNEVGFMSRIWRGDVEGARHALESTVQTVADVDARIAGWHNVWIARCYLMEGDEDATRRELTRAFNRLPPQIVLPLRSAITVGSTPTSLLLSTIAERLTSILLIESTQKFQNEISLIRKGLGALSEKDASHRQHEEAVRFLGEQLGLRATRPDNDAGTGPDVLWEDEEARTCVAFELKTNKQEGSAYNKADIAQGHDHIAWIMGNRTQMKLCGLAYIGPPGALSRQANPSELMFWGSLDAVRQIGARYIAALEDFRGLVPGKRKEPPSIGV